MSPEVWRELLDVMAECSEVTQPEIIRLVTPGNRRTSIDSALEEPSSNHVGDESAWALQSPSHSPRSLLSRAPAEVSQGPPPTVISTLSSKQDLF